MQWYRNESTFNSMGYRNESTPYFRHYLVKTILYCYNQQLLDRTFVCLKESFMVLETMAHIVREQYSLLFLISFSLAQFHVMLRSNGAVVLQSAANKLDHLAICEGKTVGIVSNSHSKFNYLFVISGARRTIL